MIARRVVVHGKVQGVFYRAWAVEQARGLGLTGWVRNRADGTVELLVMGAQPVLKDFIERLHQGPLAARVDRVEVVEAEVEAQAFNDFEKRRTL